MEEHDWLRVHLENSDIEITHLQMADDAGVETEDCVASGLG